MRPLTEDQLSMLLSEADVLGPVTADDLGLTFEQTVAIKFCSDATRFRAGTYVEKLMEQMFINGLVPCGYCFGTGETRGVYWEMRRYICTRCQGTGVAR